jgi:hypothetical protein
MGAVEGQAKETLLFSIGVVPYQRVDVVGFQYPDPRSAPAAASIFKHGGDGAGFAFSKTCDTDQFTHRGNAPMSIKQIQQIVRQA